MGRRRAPAGAGSARSRGPAPLLAFVQGPSRDVRAFCLDCLGGEAGEVEACQDQSCPLNELRLDALHWDSELPCARAEQRVLLRACRRLCLQCAGTPSGVRTCDAGGACALWEWRFGVFPQTYAAVSRRFAGSLSAEADGPPAEGAACARRPETGAPLQRKSPRPGGRPQAGAGSRRDLLAICGLK